MDAPSTSDTASNKLSHDDRRMIVQARIVARELRGDPGDRDRLAGWLMLELADLAERLGGGNGC